MHDYQSLMGEIQDVEVIMQALADAPVHVSSFDPEPVRRYYERCHAEAISGVSGTYESTWIPFGVPRQTNHFPGRNKMNLYIIRHAIAVDEATSDYASDSERPLTDKGRKKMRQIAKALRHLGVEFDLILSSPYVRACETAEILADVFKMKKKIAFSDNLIPLGNPELLISEINEKYSVEGLAIVGHEPHLSTLVGLAYSGKWENRNHAQKRWSVLCSRQTICIITITAQPWNGSSPPALLMEISDR